MPRANVNGVELYYETWGEGFPVVFCHEFAGDHRSWAPQVSACARRYRCVTFSYRGFPPSAVPEDPAAYSQDHLVEDTVGLCRYLGIDRAHFVGLSMGGSLVLNLAIRYPELCRSIVAAGAGSGTTNRERWATDIARSVELLTGQGIEAFADVYSQGPTRLPFRRKDPLGWSVFRAQLAEHSALGSALTMQGVQLRRPTIYELEADLLRLRVPTLVLIGDEDEPCVDPAVFMKRTIPACGLVVIPQSGHTINLEEPALFNRAMLDFFAMVEADRWATRETISTSLLPERS